MLLFYTPWKHEMMFSDVFREYRKATPCCNGLTIGWTIHFLRCPKFFVWYSCFYGLAAVTQNCSFKQVSKKYAALKRCSENMQHIYRKTPMLKCDFTKVTLQLYWNHSSVWVFSCNFSYFHNTFSQKHL